MEMKTWKRMLTALLLAVVMLAGSLSAFSEDAVVVADLTETSEEPTEETEPVLLASVNGEEIWSNNEEMLELINYYLSYYSSYGYDTSDPSLNAYLKAAGLHWAIESVLYHQKAAELNIPGMTDEQRAELEESARSDWESAVSYYAESQGNLTENSTEEEIAAARVKALAYIESNFGYTEESYISEFVENSQESALRENVKKALLGEFEVTEEELTAYFNSLVEQDKNTYEGNVPMYEYYTSYMGSNSYYIPEGYRGITHILLKVDADLMNTYTKLAAELEEQQEAANTAETAETTGETVEETAEATAEAAGEAVDEAAEAAGEAVDEAAETAEKAADEAAEAVEEAAADAADEAKDAAETAEKAADEAAEAVEEAAADAADEAKDAAGTAETAETTEEPAEPVTQEMVDAARQAIFDSVKPVVDEIMAKHEAGADFAELIAEYGTDPGMTTEPNKSQGYAVHADSILWDPAFTEGAMKLEKVGDVSEPVLGSNGIHILYYLRDIPAGAVELTDELRDQLKEEMLSEKENTAVTEMVDGWIAAAEIIYTDEGQAILDAAEAQEESVETTEATEEVLSNE